MSLIIDGSNGLTFPNSTTQASAGSVLQTVQGTISSYFATLSTTYVDSGLSVSITPKFATSKILILVNIYGVCSSTNNSTSYQGYIQLTDSSNNQIALISEQYVPPAAANYVFLPVPFCSLYSPATTSSLTYKIRVKGDASGHGITIGNYQNNQEFPGSITAMEIAS